MAETTTKKEPTKTNMAKALVKALNELKNPERSETADAGSYSYRYAPLPKSLEQFREVFSKHGLALMQDSFSDNGSVFVITKIIHDSGEFVESRPLGCAFNGNPQDLGKVDTYLRRYSLFSFLGIAGEDDDDAQGVQPKQTTTTQSTDEAPGNVITDREGILTMLAELNIDHDGEPKQLPDGRELKVNHAQFVQMLERATGFVSKRPEDEGKIVGKKQRVLDISDKAVGPTYGRVKKAHEKVLINELSIQDLLDMPTWEHL